MRSFPTVADGSRLIEQTPRTTSDFLKGRIPVAESIIPLDSRGRRDWIAVPDESLIAHARWVIRDKKIINRRGLAKADFSLYHALYERKLLDEAGLHINHREKRNWVSMDEEKLIALARSFMEEKGLRFRTELYRADSGLYQALLSREKKNPGVIGKVGFHRIRHEERDWDSMDDDKIVAHARRFMCDNGIIGTRGLIQSDAGLYHALLRRARRNPGIVQRAFSDVESPKHREAVYGVLSALDSFDIEG